MNYTDTAYEIFKDLDIPEWLKLNAGLQKKKSVLRTALKNKGVLKREGNNQYDRYKYFSEAQYKLLFTELLPEAGLELKVTELAYDTFEGPEKQANGRMPKLEFTLFDTESGFFETTVITGEGIDKGDKAGYKAYTGALKYYLANTFLVATGDDPENDSPDYKMNQKKQPAKKQQAPAGRQVAPDNTPDEMEKAQEKPAIQSQIDYILNNCTEDQCRLLMEQYKVDSLEKLTYFQAGNIIIRLNARKSKEMENKQ